MLRERSLSFVIEQYLGHEHAERNHQGLDNQLIAPALDSKNHSGQVRRRARLGGLLSHYYHDIITMRHEVIFSPDTDSRQTIICLGSGRVIHVQNL
jgi:hypothetical protein